MKCQICQINEAEFDAKTKAGPWGFLCTRCLKDHGIGLGVGRGQFSTEDLIKANND